ncbi:hypothetical protein [Acetoanaerobium noterae]|jgi:hypothetical protein|nr:hypothetical protein [Acetoanaerobium noterae]
MLHVSRQAFYDYLKRKDRPWKYQNIADEMFVILKEDIFQNVQKAKNK